MPVIGAVAAGSFKGKTRGDIRSSRYVVLTLEAVLWAFHTTDSFDEGALAAVNLGDDADSVGAVYGHLADASYGIDSIRASWRQRIATSTIVEGLVTRLYEGRRDDFIS